MRKADLIVCLAWIFLAIWAIFQSIKLNLGKLNDPGPGFLPFLSSVVIGSFAFIFMIYIVFKKGINPPVKIKKFQLGQQWGKAAYLMISSFIYIFFLWNNLGYLVSSTILLFFLLKVVGSESLIKSIIISVSASIVSYLIFQTWLQCSLPKGLLKGINF